MNTKEQKTFPLTFIVEHKDTYFLTIEISYTSKYFTEQYNLQLAAARDTQIKNLRCDDHEV